MKCLLIGVVPLATYTIKKTNQLDPSVIVHFITKSDIGFSSLKKPAFLSMSSELWANMLSVAGSVEKMPGYYASVSFNESGFFDDIELIEPSGMTLPWKK